MTLSLCMYVCVVCKGMCLRRYYCSRICQSSDWKEGKHKLSCRPPNNLKAGDVVLTRGLLSRTELNGEIMVVVSRTPSPSVPVPTNGGCPRDPNKSEGEQRYLVEHLGSQASTSSLSLKTANLHLLVPVEERTDIFKNATSGEREIQ